MCKASSENLMPATDGGRLVISWAQLLEMHVVQLLATRRVKKNNVWVCVCVREGERENE